MAGRKRGRRGKRVWTGLAKEEGSDRLDLYVNIPDVIAAEGSRRDSRAATRSDRRKEGPQKARSAEMARGELPGSTSSPPKI